MADKTAFPTNEWNEVLAGPLMAAMAVSAADPSGLLGLLKENLRAPRP